MLVALSREAQRLQPLAEQKVSRLAWLVGFDIHGQHCHVEPREQKLNAKGQWSRGRALELRGV